MAARAHAPAVLTLEELDEVVEAIRAQGAFCFDVETRGNFNHHPDILAAIEDEWEAKRKSLKATAPSVLARSREAIVAKWSKDLALDTIRNDVFWIGIAVDGKSWAIPMGHPNGELLVRGYQTDEPSVPPTWLRTVTKTGKRSSVKKNWSLDPIFSDPPRQLHQVEVFKALEPVFMDPNIVKVNQNIKFDAKSIAKYYEGRLPQGLYIDPIVLMSIENENLKFYDLGSILKHLFGFNPYDKTGKLGKTITIESFSDACRYVHMDARWTWLAFKRLWEKLARDTGLHDSARRDCESIRPLCQMEYNGIRVNRKEMRKLGDKLAIDIDKTVLELMPFTPIGFNPSSNQQKSKFLYGPKKEGNLGLKPKKWTDKERTTPSVDAEALTALAGDHEAADILIRYNELTTMKSTFVDGLQDFLYPVPGEKSHGLLHPNFNLHIAQTGRLSCSKPNLQNIPRDGEVRALFVAGPGDSLLVADYSQIEMRLMALFSQDPEMLRIFDLGLDPHAGTAGVILHGSAEAEVTAEERQLYGKTANFLLGYRGSAYRLRKYLAKNGVKITEEKSEEIVEGYVQGYAGYTEWQNKVVAFAKKHGYVKTLGGRMRRLPILQGPRPSSKKGWGAWAHAERQAINAVIQGTAAEICKDAMIKLDKVYEFPKCKMLLQVHDEIVSSVPSDELSKWKPIVEQTMGNGRMLDANGTVDHPVKLVVEAHYGGSWYDAK